MSAKKKLTISLIVLVAVLMIAVVAIAVVSAAVNQNISSNIKVKYQSSPQVKCQVYSTYKFGNKVNYMTTDGKSANEDNVFVNFAYKEEYAPKVLQLQKNDLKNGVLDVGDDVNEVVFTFTFKNTGKNGFTASFLTDLTTLKKNNVLLSFSTDKETWVNEYPSLHVPKPSGVTNEPIVQCYAKIAVKNLGLDASFDGNFIWNLQADEPNI